MNKILNIRRIPEHKHRHNKHHQDVYSLVFIIIIPVDNQMIINIENIELEWQPQLLQYIHCTLYSLIKDHN